MLQTIAGLFHPPEQIARIQQLGSGNVNDTFLTLADSASRQAFVMQRLNTGVFEQPELVMRNLPFRRSRRAKLAAQPPELTGRRWKSRECCPP